MRAPVRSNARLRTFCASARQGFFWWEIDISYYVLRALAAVGVIWDVREPPAHVVQRTAQGMEFPVRPNDN